MNHDGETAAYGGFADVYDALMDDYDYDAWAEHYLALLRDAQAAFPSARPSAPAAREA